MAKFYVQLVNPSQLKKSPPTPEKSDCPMLPVVAEGKYEAQGAYEKFCGILATENKWQIFSENEIVSDESLLARAEKADKLAASRKWTVK